MSRERLEDNGSLLGLSPGKEGEDVQETKEAETKLILESVNTDIGVGD